MTAAIKRFARLNAGQVQNQQLTVLLDWFGVRPKKHLPDCRLRSMSQEQLWDLFESAKCKWRQLVKQTHPDRHGDAALCAVVNATWDRIRVLFARLGIG